MIRECNDTFLSIIGFAPIERTRKVQINKVHNECMELFAYFHNKLIEALVKCTKNSLELLKKHVIVTRFVKFHV